MEYQAVSRILSGHPVLRLESGVRMSYYGLLLRYIRMGAWRSKSIAAEMGLYKSVFVGDIELKPIYGDPAVKAALRKIGEYKYFLFFDFFAVIGYMPSMISQKNLEKIWDVMIRELRIEDSCINLVDSIKSAVCFGKNSWSSIKRYKVMSAHKEFVEKIKRNVESAAGKSSRIAIISESLEDRGRLISALAGKNLNHCAPGTLRRILSKPFEDGYTDTFSQGASQKDDILYESSVTISTCFFGRLAAKKVELWDVPDRIVKKQLRSKNYDMTICVISDEIDLKREAYLKNIAKYAGDTPVIFVVNVERNIDGWDEWDIKQSKALMSCGFLKPEICPVTSIWQENDVSRYYTKKYPEMRVSTTSGEFAERQKKTGISYVEKIIEKVL